MSEEKKFKSISELASEQEDQLGHENSLAQLLFQTRPFTAWLLLVSCLGVAMVVGNLIVHNNPIRGQQIGGAVVYLGWFVLFYYAHEPYSPVSSRLRHFVVLLFFTTLGAQLAFSFLFPTIDAYEASSPLLKTMLWLLGFLSPVLIVLLSSRLLVKMENEGKPRLDQVIGTFLAMFLLPIGILLLQPRILRLRSSE